MMSMYKITCILTSDRIRYSKIKINNQTYPPFIALSSQGGSDGGLLGFEFSAYRQGAAKLCPTLGLELVDLRMNLRSKIINTRLNCIRLEGAFHKHRLNKTFQWDRMCKFATWNMEICAAASTFPKLVTQHIAMILEYLYLWIFIGPSLP